MSLNDCEWTLDEDCYETSCGKAFVMIEGTPRDNDMFFCCYCSSSIKIFFERYQHLNRVKWNVLFEDLQFEFGLLCL